MLLVGNTGAGRRRLGGGRGRAWPAEPATRWISRAPGRRRAGPAASDRAASGRARRASRPDGGAPGVRPPRRAAAKGARRRRPAATGTPAVVPGGGRRGGRSGWRLGDGPQLARLVLVGVDPPADRPAVHRAIAVDHPAGKCHRDLERHELEEGLLLLRILLRNHSAVFFRVERQCEAIQVAVPDQFHALRVEPRQRCLAITDLGAEEFAVLVPGLLAGGQGRNVLPQLREGGRDVLVPGAQHGLLGRQQQLPVDSVVGVDGEAHVELHTTAQRGEKGETHRDAECLTAVDSPVHGLSVCDRFHSQQSAIGHKAVADCTGALSHLFEPDDSPNDYSGALGPTALSRASACYIWPRRPLMIFSAVGRSSGQFSTRAAT